MKPDFRRSNLPKVVILGALGLLFWAAPVSAQLAPWQQPPYAGQADGLNDTAPGPNPLPEGEGTSRNPRPEGEGAWSDSSPTPATSEDYEQEGSPFGIRGGPLPELAFDFVHDRFWARGEFLAWWTKGFATPPLLTTSPAGTDVTQAGVLGAAGTTVLVGGKYLSGGFQPGERFSFGSWLGSNQLYGIEGSYLQVNRQTKFTTIDGTTVPILARPFFNAQSGQQDAQIVNFPGQQSGTFSSAVASELQAAEVLVRRNLRQQADLTVDLVAGYRYQQLDDHLAADDSLSFSGTQAGFPAGSTVQQSDRFDTRNVFQGGEVGFVTSIKRERLSLDTSLKIAVGDTHSRVAIEGATTTAIPGQTTTLLPGGLLALPSNMGLHDSNQFSVVPELGVSVGFDISPQLRATIGYNMLYWTNVARPGDQIDLNIDPRQLPPPAVSSASLPAFHLQTSDYWAQGLDLGLDLRF